MRVALLGCGFAADYYATTLVNHPELELAGVYDRNAAAARDFAAHWGIGRVFPELDALLGDHRVDIVVNLTNPTSHLETTRACLEAGKHVYSEKPLAMDYDDAEGLVRLAEERGLSLSGAPCNLLGEAAQTTWKAVRDGLPGRVRLVYAELDEGPILRGDFRARRSPSGIPWPYVDEFETGVTLEHAGYVISCLAAFFGPVRTATAFASVLVPEKAPELDAERMGPDVAVSCLEFDDGVVARVTCGLVAAADRTLRIFGDAGVLSCRDLWSYGSSVFYEPYRDLTRRRDRMFERHRALYLAYRRYRLRLPLVRKAEFETQWPLAMDFARGVQEQAAALREGRSSRLSARFTLHVNEVALAMQPRHGNGAVQTMRSSFEPVTPMPWADRLPPFIAGRSQVAGPLPSR